MTFSLDQRLKSDTYRLGELDNSVLLLSKNALFPWFILVPTTNEVEFHKLDSDYQQQLQQHINAIADFIETEFSTDKINIATIGNVVSQLHIHIIGRDRHDPCWPSVVWGTEHFEPYTESELKSIKDKLNTKLKDRLRSKLEYT